MRLAGSFAAPGSSGSIAIPRPSGSSSAAGTYTLELDPEAAHPPKPFKFDMTVTKPTIVVIYGSREAPKFFTLDGKYLERL